MFVSEIHLWGAAVVACVVFVAMIALAFFDRKMLRRMLVIFGATVAQMAVVVAVVWLVYQTNAWWAYLLWFLLVLSCRPAGVCILYNPCGRRCYGQ